MSSVADVADEQQKLGRERSEVLRVGRDDAGRRIDAFLAAQLPGLSRSRVQQLIAQGCVRRDSREIDDPSERVKPEQLLEVRVPAAEPAKPIAQATPLDVLYEDDHLIVLVKPAGMVVHPAPGHDQGTLVNALLAHCGDSLSGIGGVKRPGIVHRLDREVSGVMVAAKHDRAHLGLAAQFTVHSIERVYEALVWGVPKAMSGRIDRPIGRHPKDRLRMVVVGNGKRAVTHYRLLEAIELHASRLELRLETGRTHQIRVHLSSSGHAIIGDRLYMPRRVPAISSSARTRIDRLDRLALHARELAFKHPVTGAELNFSSPVPGIFGEILELLRG